MTGRSFVLVVAGALGLAACGGTDGPEVAVAEPAGASPAATPSGLPDAPEAEEPAPSAAPTASPAAAATSKLTLDCKDPAGDQKGGGKPGDLRSVVLAKSGDELTVTFTAAAAPPAAGTGLWTIDLATADQSKVLQLGAKNAKGKHSLYAFDFDSGQKNLPGTFTVDGARMVAAFPWARVASLGKGAAWGGRLALDGKDADECPGQPSAADIKAGTVKKNKTLPAAWFR